MGKLVDEIPPKGRQGVWVERLSICVQNPGRPAQVLVAKSVEAAQDAADNLRRRLVIIPRPDHQWVFTARENVVYAIYKGPGRRKNARVRRTK